jgi:hypothetical protein
MLCVAGRRCPATAEALYRASCVRGWEGFLDLIIKL